MNHLYINGGPHLVEEIQTGNTVTFNTHFESNNFGRKDSIRIESHQKEGSKITFDGIFPKNETKVQGMYNPKTQKGWLEYF